MTDLGAGLVAVDRCSLCSKRPRDNLRTSIERFVSCRWCAAAYERHCAERRRARTLATAASHPNAWRR